MSRSTWIILGVIVGIIAVITLIWAIRLVVRLIGIRKRLGDLGATGNFVFWGALAYTIFPIDLLPDPIYLDDVGVLAAAAFYLTRLLKKKDTLSNAIPHARALNDVRNRRRQRRVG